VPRPSRIRTPWKQQWRRVQYQLLPVLSFAAAVCVAMWLWGQQLGLPNGAGEVYADRMDVLCPADGRLADLTGGSLQSLDAVEKLSRYPELEPATGSLRQLRKALPEKPLRLFDDVQKDSVVAVLDHGMTMVSLKTLCDELVGLLTQLEATRATVLEARETREHAKTTEARRLATDIERLDLTIFDRQASIDADEVECARLSKNYEAMKRLFDEGVEPELTLQNIRLQRDVIQERIKGNKKARNEAEQQKQDWDRRLDEYVTAEPAALRTLLEPLHAAIVARTTRRLQADEVELKSLEARLKAAKASGARTAPPAEAPKAAAGAAQPVAARALDVDLEPEVIQLQCTLVRQRIDESTKTLSAAQQRKKAWEARLAEYVKAQDAALEMQLQPIRASIVTQQTRIDAVVLQVKALMVRSPLAGTVTAIHCWPGQNLRIGTPIMTIAAREGQYILGYVRQERGIRPRVGMNVDVKVRSLPRRSVASVVQQVGPQVEPVPLHQLRDPKIPEWGTPVRIVLPEALDLRPGELVDLVFRPTLATLTGIGAGDLNASGGHVAEASLTSGSARRTD
jgi:multidrug resistance efflux pump